MRLWAATLVLLLPLALPASISVPGLGAFGDAYGQAPQTIPAPGEPISEQADEMRQLEIRLPLAAVLGTALALRPRHRGQAPRNALVIQTQIMLAVVGAVIMLVVGQSLARAFGIVGAANLIRYRSTIDDPKEAVVMLCALAVGLAAGVGAFRLALFATAFLTLVLWIVEYFEPKARKYFELIVTAKDTASMRPKMEGVLTGFQLEFELISESEDELGYSVSAPIDVRTRDVSDTIRLISGATDAAIEWNEKKSKR